MSIQINIPDHILFEDPCILVLDKPGGLMVEPDRNGHPNLLQQVRQYLKKQAAPGEEVYGQHIHRLDRPVSGIILFSKQKAVLKNLSEQFAERRVKKFYQALTANAPAAMQGRLESWLRKEKKKAVLYGEEIPFAEKAVLDYEVSPIMENRYIWNIELHTGKYHQIRVQLATAGCPVIGDALYGSEISYRQDCIALHAARLVFSHPLNNEEIIIESRAPFIPDKRGS